MNQHFKIGDLVYVEGGRVRESNVPPPSNIKIDLALILKIHTRAHPEEVFYKLHFMEKDMEEWVAGAYLQPTH